MTFCVSDDEPRSVPWGLYDHTDDYWHETVAEAVADLSAALLAEARDAVR